MYTLLLTLVAYAIWSAQYCFVRRAGRLGTYSSENLERSYPNLESHDRRL